MSDFINFLQEIFMLKKEDNMKVGLSQLRQPVVSKPAQKEPSIRNKDVKLSDLMRRVG